MVEAHEPALAPEDDAVLIARAVRGSDDAFAKLYRRHARYIAGVVYRLLGRDAELEDTVQDTFIEGLRGLAGLRDPSQLRRWLTTIAVRGVKRRLATRYRQRDLAEALGGSTPRVSDPAAREEVESLYRALDHLPDKLRIPWILHHVEGETLPVVADICECGLSTVKRRIAAAERRMNRRLHGR